MLSSQTLERKSMSDARLCNNIPKWLKTCPDCARITPKEIVIFIILIVLKYLLATFLEWPQRPIRHRFNAINRRYNCKQKDATLLVFEL